MTDNIQHQGIVENIAGSLISVRIIQKTACSSCSAKGYCSSSESKEKVVEVIDHSQIYQVGDPVLLIGTTSMGMKAVVYAFILPFFLVVVSLFLFMNLFKSEFYAALIALAVLAPYYLFLWLTKDKFKKEFTFTIKPIK